MRSKNDVAWQKLFTQYEIVKAVNENGLFEINSSQINEYREARLMTKFDHKDSLPKLFSDENLSILPISRGNYVIGRFETFHHFERETADIEAIEFPDYLKSIDPSYIASEATAINCAFITGMFNHFMGESELFPTVNGRMGSSNIQFSIDDKNNPQEQYQIDVNNSQIEIDGGYESAHSLCLIEAKNVLAKDFLIRQLYYPYRLWSSKIKKKVRSIFLTYSNGIFHLREYTFDDLTHYNSIRLVQQKRYVIGDYTINMHVIKELRKRVQVVIEPNIPFPQADSFGRIITLCELLYQDEQDQLNSDKITESYDFVDRQTHYYAAAGRYLGLIKNERRDGQSLYSLTVQGRNLFDMPIVARRVAFAEAILAHAPFNRSLALYFEKGNRPTNAEVSQIMRECNLEYADSTISRRAQTILSWIEWILDLA